MFFMTSSCMSAGIWKYGCGTYWFRGSLCEKSRVGISGMNWISELAKIGKGGAREIGEETVKYFEEGRTSLGCKYLILLSSSKTV